jgi:hypothetical protein
MGFENAPAKKFNPGEISSAPEVPYTEEDTPKGDLKRQGREAIDRDSLELEDRIAAKVDADRAAALNSEDLDSVGHGKSRNNRAKYFVSGPDSFSTLSEKDLRSLESRGFRFTPESSTGLLKDEQGNILAERQVGEVFYPQGYKPGESIKNEVEPEEGQENLAGHFDKIKTELPKGDTRTLHGDESWPVKQRIIKRRRGRRADADIKKAA